MESDNFTDFAERSYPGSGGEGRSWENNQILEGVVVMDYPAYKFYSGQRDCHFTGAAYWLVPNRAFHDLVPKPSVSAFNFAHYDDALHAIWKVKQRGNLSSLGRYGVQGKYWRELDVVM